MPRQVLLPAPAANQVRDLPMCSQSIHSEDRHQTEKHGSCTWSEVSAAMVQFCLCKEAGSQGQAVWRPRLSWCMAFPAVPCAHNPPVPPASHLTPTTALQPGRGSPANPGKVLTITPIFTSTYCCFMSSAHSNPIAAPPGTVTILPRRKASQEAKPRSKPSSAKQCQGPTVTKLILQMSKPRHRLKSRGSGRARTHNGATQY